MSLVQVLRAAAFREWNPDKDIPVEYICPDRPMSEDEREVLEAIIDFDDLVEGDFTTECDLPASEDL